MPLLGLRTFCGSLWVSFLRPGLREFAAKQQWELEAEFVDTVTGSGKKIEPRSRQ
jgi:hypothetical protein